MFKTCEICEESYKTKPSHAHRVEYLGKTQCLKEWCKELGLVYARTYARFKSGKPLSQVFSKKGLRHANHS